MSIRNISKCGYNHSGQFEITLTDVVIEAHKCTAKFCATISSCFILIASQLRFEPFSPFIMTQILEPTHLSMSSEGGSVYATRFQRENGAHQGAVVVTPL